MSLEKAIKHGKEKRKPYSKAKTIDPYCRNHGRCLFCLSNRTFNAKKKLSQAEQKMRGNMDASVD